MLVLLQSFDTTSFIRLELHIVWQTHFFDALYKHENFSVDVFQVEMPDLEICVSDLVSIANVDQYSLAQYSWYSLRYC